MMNVNQKPSRPTRTSLLFQYVWISAIVPALIAIGGLIYFVIRESTSWAATLTTIEQCKLEKEPVDNSSLGHWYSDRTFSEGFELWDEICRLSSDPRSPFRYLLTIPGNDYPTSLNPDRDWKEKERIGSYLGHYQPILEMLDRAEEYPKPIRFPTVFNGYSTPLSFLQNAQAIQHLVRLDFEYASYCRDTTRALMDLRRMKTIEQSFHSSLCVVGELVHLQLLNTRLAALGRSLSYSAWSEEELSALEEECRGAVLTSDAWKSIFLGERACYLSEIHRKTASWLKTHPTDAVVPYPLLPSEEQMVLNYFQKILDLGTLNPEEITAYALSTLNPSNLTKKRLPLDRVRVTVSSIDGSVQGLIRGMHQSKELRNIVRTSVALRRYEHRHARWPVNLYDLESLGLKIQDYSTPSGKVFGYQVEEGVACLWGTDPQTGMIGDQCPPGEGIPETDRPDPKFIRLFPGKQKPIAN
jgi:hypothetical protein